MEINKVAIIWEVLTIYRPSYCPMATIKVQWFSDRKNISANRRSLHTWKKTNRDKIKTSENARGVSITYTSDQAFLAIKNSAEVEIVDEYSSIIRSRASNILIFSNKVN